MTPYEEGYAMGKHRRTSDDYDPRWDFAAAAKAGTFDEFKRGFTAGFENAE